MAGSQRRPTGSMRDYLELTKPRLTLMALLSMIVGYAVGTRGHLEIVRLLAVSAGTWLLGLGSGALNQYLERDTDGRMRRTCRRPLPAGRLPATAALRFGVVLATAGLLVLTLAVNPLAGGLGAAALAIYLFVYTPMKRRSALCTLVGAIPGALPPVIGWAAARGTVDAGGWAIFTILFVWQLPHFLAIGWMYREDYARAGLFMLPVLDPVGHTTGRQIILYCLALVPASLIPTMVGTAGVTYFVGALIAGLTLLTLGVAMARVRSRWSATRLFRASLVYLSVVLVLMTMDAVRG